MSDIYDCVVVGGGPGGHAAAVRASQLGMRTALVEREPTLGGRCLNLACIPAKTVLRSADYFTAVRHCAEFGIKAGEPKVDFSVVAARRDRMIAGLASGVSHQLRENDVELVPGEGRLTPEGGVLVGNRRLETTRAIILATGSVRRTIPGLAYGRRVVGTEEAWALDRLPDSMAIVGAGASGVELASAYARLGSSVVLLEAADRVLPAEEPEISSWVQGALEDQGVEVCTSARIGDVLGNADGVGFCTGTDRYAVGLLIVAAGRTPDVEALGLAGAGVRLDSTGFVEVDRCQRTTATGIYAIGDLVDGPALAHKASEEGVQAIEHAAGVGVEPVGRRAIPRVTFAEPNVASVGLGEEEARKLGYEVVTGRAPFGSVGAGALAGARGFVKVVADGTTGEILGGHVVGERAGELVQQLTDAMILEGSCTDLARIVHAHPALSEVVLEAVRAVGDGAT